VLNYGDGSPALELGAFTAPATTSHEYMRLGAYTARLDATTVSGETRSATVPIKVDTLVTASIVTTNLGNLNVEAVADISGAPVLRYEWSFEPFPAPGRDHRAPGVLHLSRAGVQSRGTARRAGRMAG
jgi:hypothetical protein